MHNIDALNGQADPYARIVAVVVAVVVIAQPQWAWLYHVLRINYAVRDACMQMSAGVNARTQTRLFHSEPE